MSGNERMIKVDCWPRRWLLLHHFKQRSVIFIFFKTQAQLVYRERSRYTRVTDWQLRYYYVFYGTYESVKTTQKHNPSESTINIYVY